MVPKKISSLQHPFIKSLVVLRKDKHQRNAQGQVLILGIKMVEELQASGLALDVLIVEEEKALKFPFPAKEIIHVSQEILKKISGVPEPEPIAAVVSLPAFKIPSPIKRLLVLDGVADPGNVGTLIRTALALGWEGVYLIENTCDPFNEKALRAAKGATFRIPLGRGSWDDFLCWAKEHSAEIIVADTEGICVDQFSPKSPLALLLSRESQGARDEAKNAFRSITIPMNGSMESLNVASAGSILLYQLRNVHGL